MIRNFAKWLHKQRWGNEPESASPLGETCSQRGGHQALKENVVEWTFSRWQFKRKMKYQDIFGRERKYLWHRFQLDRSYRSQLVALIASRAECEERKYINWWDVSVWEMNEAPCVQTFSCSSTIWKWCMGLHTSSLAFKSLLSTIGAWQNLYSNSPGLSSHLASKGQTHLPTETSSVILGIAGHLASSCFSQKTKSLL